MKREDHYKEWLKYEIERNYLDIPEEVMSLFPEDSSIITSKLIRSILLKNKMIEYIEKTPSIYYKIHNIKLPMNFPKDELLMMFPLISESFERNRGLRKSFFSYNYVTRKCLEIIDRKEFLDIFPVCPQYLLKVYDPIWDKIYEDVFSKKNNQITLHKDIKCPTT
jgi:hypothetical protein